MSVLDRRSAERGARHERAIVRVRTCQINPDKENHISNCETQDVSISGVSVAVPVALPENAQVEVWLEIKGLQKKFLLSGIVRWCHQDSNQWVCGLEFQAESQSDLQDWEALFL